MVSEEYFYINSFGDIAKTTREYENKIDEMRIKIGNCFQTEENAQFYAEKFKNLFLEKE